MPDLSRQSQGLGKRPALVLVDMIQGFTNPASALGTQVDAVVDANRILLESFRQHGLPVFFTTVTYRDETQAAVFRARVPALNELVAGSQWVKVDRRLSPRANETVIEKCWASGFFKTNLDQLLRDKERDSIVVTGLTTSGCVRATAVDGLQYDYRVVVPREAVGDRNLQAHEANLFDMHAKYADVMALQDVLDAIKSLAAGCKK
ncbi:MAG: maleamate amidohydrolase [Lysobacterales bacterium]|jgi:maleamate amidohydrolase